jgi:hypothetical protein
MFAPANTRQRRLHADGRGARRRPLSTDYSSNSIVMRKARAPPVVSVVFI